MHSSSLGSDFTLFSVVTIIVICVLAFGYILAWFFSMKLITKSAKERGHGHITDTLWFIGLFASPITPALITSILPDKSGNPASARNCDEIEAELPKI